MYWIWQSDFDTVVLLDALSSVALQQHGLANDPFTQDTRSTWPCRFNFNLGRRYATGCADLYSSATLKQWTFSLLRFYDIKLKLSVGKGKPRQTSWLCCTKLYLFISVLEAPPSPYSHASGFPITSSHRSPIHLIKSINVSYFLYSSCPSPITWCPGSSSSIGRQRWWKYLPRVRKSSGGGSSYKY